MIPHSRRPAILFALSTLLLAAAPGTVMSRDPTDPLDSLAAIVEIPGDTGDVDPVDGADTMTAPPPADFIESASTLSQAEYPRTIREAFRVPMADGERLYVEMVRPDPDAHGNGPWPVIMEVSPYHGTLADRSGTRIFPDPEDEFGTKIGLTGYFAPRGYAVAIVDLRGTGRSTGCLDHIGQNDASDLETIIEWAAALPWSNGRVGLTGGDNSDALPNTETGCGLPNSSLTAGSGQVTGQYEDWHAQRDWRDGAALADIPVFMVHGVNDNAARIPAAEWFFGRRFGNRDDKVWLGQWDHGSTNGRCGDENGGRTLHPNCRFDQWKYALHAWFDKHLKGSNVQTGPAVEVFLNGATPIDVTQVMDPEQVGGKVFTAKADVDLYLQRQVNGGRGGSLAAAESGSLEQELLIAGRQAPGHYRIVVHNWAGAPAEVQLTLTFFNQEGEAGGAGGTGLAGEPVQMFSDATTLLPQP